MIVLLLSTRDLGPVIDSIPEGVESQRVVYEPVS